MQLYNNCDECMAHSLGFKFCDQVSLNCVGTWIVASIFCLEVVPFLVFSEIVGFILVFYLSDFV